MRHLAPVASAGLEIALEVIGKPAITERAARQTGGRARERI